MKLNRRNAIKYTLCATVAGIPASTLAQGSKIREINIDYHDKYWEAQAKIDALEEEVQELRSHARVLQMNRTFSK